MLFRSDAHPPYNTIEIVRDPKAARSGDHFLRMRTLGGLTAYRLSPRRAWTVDARSSKSDGGEMVSSLGSS